MKVFVTGADGFVGRHLVRRLVGAGDVVAAATRPGERAVDWPKVAPSGTVEAVSLEITDSDLRGARAAMEARSRRPSRRRRLGARSAARPGCRVDVNAVGTARLVAEAARLKEAGAARSAGPGGLDRRGVRSRERGAPSRDRPAGPAFPVRGEQGRRRGGRAGSVATNGSAGGGRATFHAHRTGAGDPVRGSRRGPSDSARPRYPVRPPYRRATSSRCGIFSTCVMSSRPIVSCSRAASRARSTMSHAVRAATLRNCSRGSPNHRIARGRRVPTPISCAGPIFRTWWVMRRSSGAPRVGRRRFRSTRPCGTW